MLEKVPVLINVQTALGEEEGGMPIEEIVRGVMTKTDDMIVLEYDNVCHDETAETEKMLACLIDDDDEDHERHVRITVTDTRVTVDTVGARLALFVYELGRRYITELQLPYGNLQMGVYTTRYYCKCDDQEGLILIEYACSMNDSDLGLRHMQISYTRVDEP